MGVLPLDSLMPIVRLRIYEALTIDGHDLVDADYIAVEVDEDVTLVTLRWHSVSFRLRERLNTRLGNLLWE